MRISFSIPAYNEEQRIARCLESIRNEVMRAGMEHDAEIVVVNNASTDRTPEIARSIPGVRVVDESQKGLVHARQKGFDATTGELLANIDADTIMPAGWLPRVLAAFDRDPKLVALSGPYYYFDLSRYQRFWVLLFYLAGYLEHLVSSTLRVGAMLQGGNFIVRRSAMEEIGGFDTSIEFYGEDTDVARRMVKIGRVRWAWNLTTWSSGRRLAHEGVIRTGLRYGFNHLWVLFTKKPWSGVHTDIRTD